MAEEPNCFGQSWEASASECAGGYDSGYLAPDGSHLRKRCQYYDSCKVRTLLKNSNSQQAVPLRTSQNGPPAGWQVPNPWQPPQPQPIRQSTPQQAPQMPQAMMPPQMQQMQQMMQQMQAMQQMMQQMGMGMPVMMGMPGMMPGMPQQPFMPHPWHLQPPAVQQVPYQMAPMQLQASYNDMPAYLSAPETVQHGESLWYPLGREVLRGMGKALGHSLAHFFDHVAWGGR